MKKSVNGSWLILFAAILWGTTGTSQAFAPEGFDSTTIGAMRLGIGGTALLFLSKAKNQQLCLRQWPIRTTLFSALFIGLYQVFFFIAVVKTGVAVGTIIGIGSAPIAGGLLGLAFRGETLSRRWIMATFIAIAGCTLLSLSGGNSHSQINLIGIILAIGAGASYAAYTLTIKSLLDRFTPDQVIAVTFILGAILLTPLIAAKDMSWLLQMRSIMIVLHLGLVTAAIAYWLFAQGLKTATVATATTLSLAEPLTAGMLGVIVLGEKLKALSALGICLMILGLVILALGGQKSLRTPQ